MPCLYCVPTSAFTRLSTVGSTVERRVSHRERYEVRLGSKRSCTASVCPERPEHTCGGVGKEGGLVEGG